MDTKDHKLLAEYITENSGLFEKKIHKRAFIFGSIEPDVNLFSYFKGSMKNEFLRGHSFRSSLNYFRKVSERLMKKNRSDWNVTDYYSLGKIVHYVADDFTHPHNDNFVGSLSEHCAYELKLHELFGKSMGKHRGRRLKHFFNRSISDTVSSLHEEYMLSAPAPANDAKWILTMTWLTVRCLLGDMVSAKAPQAALI